MVDYTVAPIQKTLPNFNGVAAGSKPTLDVPAQGVYYDITLEYRESGTLVTQANMEAAITKVTHYINGNPVRTETAREIIDRNAYHGIAYQAGFLPLFYAESWQVIPELQDSLRWGMADVQTFQIEVEIASGRVAPTLKAIASHKDLANVNLGAIKKVRKYTVPSSGTGEITYTGIPMTETITAIHADVSINSVVIDDVKIIVNNKEHMVLTGAQNSQLLTGRGKAVNADYFHIDFTSRNRHTDGLKMVQQDGERVSDMRVIFNESTGGGLPLIVETIGQVSNR